MTSTNKPWAADIEISTSLATALIQEQFAFDVKSITEMEAGWDNQPFLVNDELVFRFPRRKVAVELLEHVALAVDCEPCVVSLLQQAAREQESAQDKEKLHAKACQNAERVPKRQLAEMPGEDGGNGQRPEARQLRKENRAVGCNGIQGRVG